MTTLSKVFYFLFLLGHIDVLLLGVSIRRIIAIACCYVAGIIIIIVALMVLLYLFLCLYEMLLDAILTILE